MARGCAAPYTSRASQTASRMQLATSSCVWWKGSQQTCARRTRHPAVSCRASSSEAHFRLGSVLGPASKRTAQLTQAPSPPLPQPVNSGVPVPVIVLAAGAAFAFLARKWQRTGSLYGLEDRGYLDSNRHTLRPEGFTKVMKSVNTVPMPALSEDQIAAARARRQKERANHKLRLEDIELPENHPWATKAVAPQGDDERVRARLRVRRGAAPPPPTSDGGEEQGDAAGSTPARRRQQQEQPKGPSRR